MYCGVRVCNWCDDVLVFGVELRSGLRLRLG